ncbi:hypothetical protein ALMP_72420 [Streptomyces sp. A012304]|nr:hypothetical protein ALMP_72420 [Streptomyces sp. A012304]
MTNTYGTWTARSATCRTRRHSVSAPIDDAGSRSAAPRSSSETVYEPEVGRHVPPDRVWSAWLCGDHLVSERREVLSQFANGIDAAGRRVHRAFLAAVRVLGEA